MIQLASDPNASRQGWRPAPAEAKGIPIDARRARAAHAWPFISRLEAKPAAEQPAEQTTRDSGS